MRSSSKIELCHPRAQCMVSALSLLPQKWRTGIETRESVERQTDCTWCFSEKWDRGDKYCWRGLSNVLNSCLICLLSAANSEHMHFTVLCYNSQRAALKKKKISRFICSFNTLCAPFCSKQNRTDISSSQSYKENHKGLYSPVNL